MSPVYTIPRRINAPLQFVGLKAQYIFYAGGIVIAALLLFAVLYIIGLNSWLALLIGFGSGAFGLGRVHWLSHHYGEYGLQKHGAARRLPKTLRITSRTLFITLKK